MSATIVETSTRQCMNCGRPQDHRWHDRDTDEWRALSNGCTSVITRPQTLWDAVLRHAMLDAAHEVGVDMRQAFDEISRAWRS